MEQEMNKEERKERRSPTSPRKNRISVKINSPNSTTPLRAQLRAALVLARPDIAKPYLYDRCVDKYLTVMLPAISQAIALNHKSKSLDTDCFLLPQAALKEQMGTLGKKQDYIHRLMKEHATTSLILVQRKGFNINGESQISTVKLNPIYKDLIVDELLNLRIEANVKLLDEIERTANNFVCVDPASLSSFIDKTSDTSKTTRCGAAYKDALLRNLTAARQLQTMIHAADETHATAYINERWEMADCGRIYGQGYSLQRMPKDVRHAALGVCHKYDFKASAFALMASLAHAINPTLKIAGVLDYVNKRQVIRKQIAKQLSIPESLVKTIFTAIGFGAELKNNTHNAIRGELARAARLQHDPAIRLERDVYNNLGADEFKRLVENTTFSYIYAQLQLINTTILSYFSANELEINGKSYSPIHPKTGKQRNDRQKLAWIYQALESKALQQFIDLVPQDPLLTTHDCLYFKQKLHTELVKDVNCQLQDTFPYLRFEHEAILPITEDAYFYELGREQREFEATHKRLIAEEETKAKIHYADKPNPYVTAVDIPHYSSESATERAFNEFLRHLEEQPEFL